jgi:OPT oligopeptide transporter protein
MSVYKEVPHWWYSTIFGLHHLFFYKEKYADTLSVTMFVFGVIVIEVWETDLPVWGFVLALLICALCLILRHCVLSSRVSHSLRFSVHVFSPFERDPGHYKPDTGAERHHGADHRIRPSWPPDCNDVVQDMGSSYHVTGNYVHEQLQAWPLHEDRAGF